MSDNEVDHTYDEVGPYVDRRHERDIEWTPVASPRALCARRTTTSPVLAVPMSLDMLEALEDLSTRRRLSPVAYVRQLLQCAIESAVASGRLPRVPRSLEVGKRGRKRKNI